MLKEKWPARKNSKGAECKNYKKEEQEKLWHWQEQSSNLNHSNMLTTMATEVKITPDSKKKDNCFDMAMWKNTKHYMYNVLWGEALPLGI